MDYSSFDEVIEFAIAREKEAVKFYHDLQNLVPFKSKQNMLKELEEMEQGHIKMLQGIQKNVSEEKKLSSVKDLALSEYLVEAKPNSELSFQDIVIIAMKREERAQSLYQNLAEQSSDQKIKNLFLRIANEETKHKLHFERIYDEEILREN